MITEAQIQTSIYLNASVNSALRVTIEKTMSAAIKNLPSSVVNSEKFIKLFEAVFEITKKRRNTFCS